MNTKQTTPVCSLANVAQQQVELTSPVSASIKQATRARPGQPTCRTEENVEEILDRIACGEALMAICQDDHLPGYSTFNRWCRHDSDLLKAVDEAYCFHARTMDDMADSILSGGVGSTGEFRRDEARVAHLRWRLGKLNRRFGDKTSVDLTSTVNIAMPAWANALPAAPVIDGEIIDPDAIHEAETVKRIMDARKDQDPDT